jgi:asparagine synthase (glutamine-hydrolysing)
MADRWARPLRKVPSVARRFALGALNRYCPVSDKRLSFEYKLKRWIEGSFLPADEAHFFWNGAFSRAQQREIRLNTTGCGPDGIAGDLPPARKIGYLNRYLFFDQQSYLPADILHKVDRMSMAHSLEVRPPFLDHRIVEFAASLPEDFKIRGFSQKYLIRELMRGKLPELVLRRKKSGFDIPAHEWFRGPLRPLLYEALSPTVIAATGLFDASAIDRLVRLHLERRLNVGYHLWGLVTLFVWMRRWRIEAHGEDLRGRGLVSVSSVKQS